MRSLHLCFWLHHAYELHEADKWAQKGYYGGEVAFREADEREFQPFLALLERNSQRYRDLHVSLVVTGVWLEQAERWDAELICRVKKLVEKGAVELVVSPYYHSMAAFYDLDELKTQVLQMQEKLEQVFGAKSEILALPGYCYHNRLAKWAEKLGFREILAGESTKSLGWRSPNMVYEAKNCANLRVLSENAVLARSVETGSDLATERAPEGTTEVDLQNGARSGGTTGHAERLERVFSAKMFQKQLDLAFLRGDLVNLYFDTEVYANWRDAGIIGFFDELLKYFAETPGLRLVGAEDLLKVEPVAEISVKNTAAKQGEAEESYAIPGWWLPGEAKNSQNLYNLRKNVVETHDRDLYVDFAKLTGLEYAKGGKAFEEIMADIQKRLLKLLQDQEASPDVRGQGSVMTSTAVKIKFDHKARERRKRREALVQLYAQANSNDEAGVWGEDELDDAEAAIQVLAQRMQKAREADADDYSDATEAEVVMEDIWMDSPEGGAEDDSLGGDGLADDAEPVTTTDKDAVDDAEVEDLMTEEFASDEKPQVKKKRKKIIIE